MQTNWNAAANQRYDQWHLKVMLQSLASWVFSTFNASKNRQKCLGSWVFSTFKPWKNPQKLQTHFKNQFWIRGSFLLSTFKALKKPKNYFSLSFSFCNFANRNRRYSLYEKISPPHLLTVCFPQTQISLATCIIKRKSWLTNKTPPSKLLIASANASIVSISRWSAINQDKISKW